MQTYLSTVTRETVCFVVQKSLLTRQLARAWWRWRWVVAFATIDTRLRQHFLDRADARQHRRSLHRHENYFRVVGARHVAHAVDVACGNHVVRRVAAGN